MPRSFEAVVVGGGIVGWSAAYRLSRHGCRTAVIDQNHKGQATAAGAGIISPGSGIHAPKKDVQLIKAAVGYYPTLIEQLKEDGQPETGFASPGALFVFQNEDEYSRISDVRSFAENLRASGVRSIGEISVLSGNEAKEVFPPLASMPGALHLSEGSRVDGKLLRDALRKASLGRGVIEIVGHVDVRDRPTKGISLTVDAEQVGFGSLLIAGGAWTPELFSSLGLDVPVMPQRGQILHLEAVNTATSSWPIIHGFHNHYLLAFPTSRVVAGATREDKSGFDYRKTAGGVQQELSEALRVAPGLSNATLSEVRVGFRPSSADGLPILGKFATKENLYVATGHGSGGLTLGPVSGAAVADELVGATPDFSLDAFSPHRFS